MPLYTDVSRMESSADWRIFMDTTSSAGCCREKSFLCRGTPESQYLKSSKSRSAFFTKLTISFWKPSWFFSIAIVRDKGILFMSTITILDAKFIRVCLASLRKGKVETSTTWIKILVRPISWRDGFRVSSLLKKHWFLKSLSKYTSSFGFLYWSYSIRRNLSLMNSMLLVSKQNEYSHSFLFSMNTQDIEKKGSSENRLVEKSPGWLIITPHKALITLTRQVFPELLAPYMQTDLTTLSTGVSITFDAIFLLRMSALSEKLVSCEKMKVLLNLSETSMNSIIVQFYFLCNIFS